MYPRISDLFKDLLGFELPFPIYSFGFMVAIAVMLAAWLTQIELDRLYRAGRIGSVRIPDKAAKGRKGTIEASPSHLMGTVTVLAVVGGFSGAKLFHIFENLGDFFADPFGMVFSSGGFTFYGGLIVASVLIAWYVKRHRLPVPLFADAVAPGLMLAYGVGRIGCHLAGDGDWGIASNLADKPSWIPAFLWSETYPRNIWGVDLSAAPVFPTPLYEFMMAAALAGILWSLRDHPYVAGWLFSLYLVFNGVERFLIEKIRVNNVFDFLGIQSTQAELIAVFLMALGVVGLVRFRGRREAARNGNAAAGAGSGAGSAVGTATGSATARPEPGA